MDFQRRLPIYLLLDCSESMVGEPLEAVNQGVQQLCSDLKSDPMAIETAWLSLIAFWGRAHQLCPLTDIVKCAPPLLTVGPGTALGAAFDLLGQCIAREVRRSTPTQKGDWKPIAFLLTDGAPTDAWQEGFSRFRAATHNAVNVIAVGCGPDVDTDVLRAITPNVLHARQAAAGDLKAFFKWVSSSVRTASVGMAREGQPVNLPAPPADTLAAPTARPATGRAASQVILAARCREHGRPYLMRYRRGEAGEAAADAYLAEKAYPVGEDYFAESSAGPAGLVLDASQLQGAPPCPHCGRPGWTATKDRSSLECCDQLQFGGHKAQVLFVLDVTGSMAGEIEGVKDNIKDFISHVQAEGLAVEVGLIAFRDLQEGEKPEVLQFDQGPFTHNAALFKKKVSKLTATGGGANPGESSLDALVLACRQPFADGACRILVLITDEPPLLPDGKVKSLADVVSALQQARIDQFHLVLPDYVRGAYEPLHRALKGEVFPLGAGGRGGRAFRRVLLDIGQSITVTARLG